MVGQFLGTGAADWQPAFEGQGTTFRRFSSMLINDDLLIDPGPHVFHFEKSCDKPILKGIKHVVVTHSHADHFSSETVKILCLEQGAELWGDDACYRKLCAAWGEDEAKRMTFHSMPISIGEPETVGDYRVWSLRANHVSDDPQETARSLMIEKDGRLLFYGCDSSWIPTTTWNIIKKYQLNALVLDCTCGEGPDWRLFEHNTIDMLNLMMQMFKSQKLFAPDVRFYASHMAKTLHHDHETLVKQLGPLGMIAAYDGLQITI